MYYVYYGARERGIKIEILIGIINDAKTFWTEYEAIEEAAKKRFPLFDYAEVTIIQQMHSPIFSF